MRRLQTRTRLKTRLHITGGSVSSSCPCAQFKHFTSEALKVVYMVLELNGHAIEYLNVLFVLIITQIATFFFLNDVCNKMFLHLFIFTCDNKVKQQQPCGRAACFPSERL